MRNHNTRRFTGSEPNRRTRNDAETGALCGEYLVDLNATQAALRAGYSRFTARQIASENLSKPYIRDRISQLREERSRRTQVSVDRVLEELAAIAVAKLADYTQWTDDGPAAVDPATLSRMDMAEVRQLDFSESLGYFKIRLTTS